MMQCMRVLRRLRIFGRPVGVGLTWLIVLFSSFVGPIYFARAIMPRPSALFEWFHRHAVLVLGVSLVALILVRVGSLLARRSAAARRAWLAASCEFLVVIAIVLQICAMQRTLYADAFPYVDDLNESFRKPVETQLAAAPGEHLVLVRYSKDHNSGEEYVYNDADIDHAKTVWAREIPGMDLGPLFSYFRNRDVWLYEPDEDDSIVQPYAEPAR
jgi:hypothetical protein